MKDRKGFTLIELLVVIAIMSILAGQLLPALSTAREKGKQANCMNNLKQFSYAIEMYRMDCDDYPDWLSSLYGPYLGKNLKIFTCLSDTNKGKEGHGEDLYNTVEDCSDPDPDVDNSYLYTFNPNKYYDASLGTGNLSWKEASLYLAKEEGHAGHVPIVRCLWHWLNDKGKVLNIAYEDYNVYLSGLEWETTSP